MPSFDFRYCRVCGYDASEWLPWGEDGRFGSFDICPCCNVEWGYEDSTFESTADFRAEWIRSGAKWSDRRIPPDGLGTHERLKRAWIKEDPL